MQRPLSKPPSTAAASHTGHMMKYGHLRHMQQRFRNHQDTAVSSSFFNQNIARSNEHAKQPHHTAGEWVGATHYNTQHDGR